MLALVVLVLIGWAVVGYRLFVVQVVEGADYSAAAEAQRFRELETSAVRGSIYDRQGRVMAVSVDSRSVYADPRQVEDPAATALLLANILQTDVDKLEERLRTDTTFVFVARQLDDQSAAEIEALDLPGIHFLTEPKRAYPSGTVASHVLGFVDIDSNGIEGLELFYNQQLAGAPGRVSVEIAPGGVLIPQGRHEVKPAIPGMDLVTTLDREIQFTAEQSCEQALETTLAERCTVVVLGAESFEVLAMAVIPTFDLNDRRNLDPNSGVLTNAVIRSVYEPGSIQKLVTVAAAIEEEVVDWDTLYLVPDTIEVVEGACASQISIEEEPISGCYRDFEPHPDEVMSVKECLRDSSNVCTVKIVQDLGVEKLERYLTRFGYGFATGIDFPGEAVGNVNLELGCSTCPTSAAIGYSLSVTPLQIASFYAVVANGGVWKEPKLVAGRVDEQGRGIIEAGSSRRVISDSTARIMRVLLQEVVENGTGQAASVPGYSVGGKTGTARKFDPQINGYSEEVIVSFVGMAPVEDPRFVVAVIIDSPQVDRSGGLAAAPVFAQVMEKALHQLGVPADAY